MVAPARSQGAHASHAHGLAHKTSFSILQDGLDRDKMHLHPATDKDVASLSRALGELAIDNCQNIASLAQDASEPKFIKAQIEQHSRLQRPALSAQTFEPLALDGNDRTAPNKTAKRSQCDQLLAEASSCTLPNQVQKHLAATPISGTKSAQENTMSWQSEHNPPPYEASALKVPEVVDMVEHALSPALSGISDRSESFAGSSRTGSFSVPRIEDSLEELDKLEEELEAVGALAKVKQVSPTQDARSPAAKPAGNSPAHSAKSMKRSSMMSLSSKSSQPSLRQSASMTLRQKNQQPATPPTKKFDSPASRSSRPSVTSTPSRSPTSKSTKAPTVAKFELPGEAVARRLKEQREARQALLEKSQKANVAPPKPRTVTKPSFELPGEAISRRKREQHEAKLRAEEEEMRRKREFKARPIRNSSAPGAAPRETIASRARQAKLQEEEAKARAAAAAAATKNKRMSMNVSQAPATVKRVSSVPQTTQRPTSSLGAKTARRQSTISDGIANAKLRPKPTQETGVKSAREQAAERSRAASREWAEKKRRQEAQKERRESQATVS